MLCLLTLKRLMVLQTVPVFPLEGVLFTRGQLPLNIFEPLLQMFESALAKGRLLGVVQP